MSGPSRKVMAWSLGLGAAVLAAGAVSARASLLAYEAFPYTAGTSMAGPLQETPGGLELLYITLPAAFATGEWLALVSLAAEEFRHAEETHRARAQAAAEAPARRLAARLGDQLPQED